MKNTTIILLTVILVLLSAMSLNAQDSQDIKNLFDQQFNYATRILDLAKETPAESYSWSPAEDVRTMGEVYTHIVQANYMMIGAFGISAPVDVESIGSLTDKDKIVAAFEQSNEFVKTSVAGLSDEQLAETYELFGRTINGEGILVFILSHTSEHGGQVIAYARMNDITPPWSE